MPLPTFITGAIVPRTLSTANALPKAGFTAPDYSNAFESEIFTKTPSVAKSGGTTLAGFSTIYLNSSDFVSTNRTITCAFMPDFYIAAPNEINIAWKYATTSVDFSTANPSITATSDDKFEAFYIQTNKQAFLTSAGGGATADAITGITFGKGIFSGNQILNADQIYYRYLGDKNVQS
jgi:hypothetical protein